MCIERTKKYPIERNIQSFRRPLERKSTGISAAAHQNITFEPPSMVNQQALYPVPKTQVRMGFQNYQIDN